MPPKLIIEVLGDTSNLERSLKRAGRSADTFGSKLSRTATNIAKAGVFAGAAAGIAGVTVALRAGISEFADSTKVAAQTAAAIKSTGGVANVTAKQIDRLSRSLLNQTGVDDELVKTSANLLLTFKNVRNEIGRGNDIFTQATKAALDLSRAGFGSVETASKMLGKALNDPVKGMTALGRAGVTFSDAQKKTIKGLVETGHFLKAQGVLLKEVTSQVGGSAVAYGRTLPGMLSILRENLNNVAGDIVGKYAPAFTVGVRQATKWIQNSENQRRVIAAVQDAVGKLQAIMQTLIVVVRTATDVAQKFSGAVGGAENAVKLLGSTIVGLKLAGLIAGLRATGVAAAGASASVTALSARLALLRTAGPIAIGVSLVLWKDEISDWFERHKLGFLNTHVEDLPGAARDALTGGGQKTKPDDWVLGQFGWERRKTPKVSAALRSPLADAASRSAAGGGLTPGKAAKAAAATSAATKAVLQGIAALSDKQRNALALAQAELTKSTKDDLAALATQRSLLAREIAATRTKLASATGDEASKLADTLEGLLGEDAQALSRIVSIQEGAAQDAKSQAAKIKAAAAKREKAVRDAVAALISGSKLGVKGGPLTVAQVNKAIAGREQSFQFRALGLTGEGGERAPTVKGLRAMLGNLERDFKGTALDTTKMRSRMAAIRKILSGEFGKAGADVRRTIKGMFDDFEGLLGDRGPLTKARAVNTKPFIEGLGLTGVQGSVIRGRIAGEHLTTTPGRARSVGRTDAHIHVSIDGREIARVVAPEINKRNRRSARQTSGRIGP